MRLPAPARAAAPAIAFVTAFVTAALGLGAAEPARDYPVKPVPFTAVHFTDSFWLPRIEVNRTVTIPFAFEKCEETKRVYHFERAAAVLRGEPLADKTPPGYPFDDSDLYKVIEGAAYTLSVAADPKLEAYLDTLIAKIAAAQEPDGYLYTTRTIDPARRARPGQPPRARVQPVARAGRRAGRGGRPRGARHLHVLRDGGRGGAHRRGRLRPGDGPDLGRRRRQEALPHRRHRRDVPGRASRCQATSTGSPTSRASR